jgi:hypothetical protein
MLFSAFFARSGPSGQSSTALLFRSFCPVGSFAPSPFPACVRPFCSAAVVVPLPAVFRRFCSAAFVATPPAACIPILLLRRRFFPPTAEPVNGAAGNVNLLTLKNFPTFPNYP